VRLSAEKLVTLALTTQGRHLSTVSLKAESSVRLCVPPPLGHPGI
jgi:hypothetical protein